MEGCSACGDEERQRVASFDEIEKRWRRNRDD